MAKVDRSILKYISKHPLRTERRLVLVKRRNEYRSYGRAKLRGVYRLERNLSTLPPNLAGRSTNKVCHGVRVQRRALRALHLRSARVSVSMLITRCVPFEI